MKKRILGKDLEVSAIGLGCMGMSHAYGPAADKKEMTELLAQAVDKGYTFFDTAEVYGTPENPHDNEELLGEALKPYRSQITHWGISEADEETLRRAHAVCPVAAVQNRYSMMYRDYEALFPVLEELQIGFVAFSPLANGFLTAKYGKESKFEKGTDYRSAMPQFTPEAIDKNQEMIGFIREMAEKKEATPAQISLAWMLAKEPWIVPIPGMRKYDRLVENADASEVELTDSDSIRRAVDRAMERFGRIDVLVNNAGHGYRAAVEEGEEESIGELYGTNFFGPAELIRLVLPQMRERKSGAIINLSSIAALGSGVGSGYYASSKAAVELLSDALYQEVSPLGIRVMVVEPGQFRTRFFDDSLKGTKIQINDYKETAGKNRKENIVNRHDQPGDPDKGGQIIVDTIEEEYPRTLVLGRAAVDFVRTALNRRLDELEKWKTVSFESDFE